MGRLFKYPHQQLHQHFQKFFFSISKFPTPKICPMAPQSQTTANLIAVLAIFIVVTFSQIANSMHLNGSSSHSGIKKPLRIAHVGGLNVEIPPKNVGGLEKVVEVLMFEQIRAGHHVTLFCTKDSGNMEAQRKKYGISEEQLKNHFRLIPSSRKSLHLHTRNYEEYVQKVKPFVPYLREFQQEIIRHVENGEFDVVHYHSMDHFEYDGTILERFNHMTLTTMHMALEGERTVRMLSKYPQAKLVPISNDQKSHLAVQKVPGYAPHWEATVYNGYPLNLYKFKETPEPTHPSWLKEKDYVWGNPSRDGVPYLAFLGRFSADKGAHNAVKIARKAGVELRIAAKIPVVGDQDWEYFTEKLMPLMEGAEDLIKLVGPIDDSQKSEFLGNAKALLFPIEWQEPFGLVMIEAMACGTPVIAPQTGSVPEVILENAGLIFGIHSRIVDGEKRVEYSERTIEEATKLVHQAGHLDRQKVRHVFEQHFSVNVMTGGYQKIYEKIVLEAARNGGKPNGEAKKTGENNEDDLDN